MIHKTSPDKALQIKRKEILLVCFNKIFVKIRRGDQEIWKVQRNPSKRNYNEGTIRKIQSHVQEPKNGQIQKKENPNCQNSGLSSSIAYLTAKTLRLLNFRSKDKLKLTAKRLATEGRDSNKQTFI